MKFKTFALSFLLTTLLLSCRNPEEESNTDNPKNNTRETETSPEIEKEISMIEREAVIEKLQGNWKEPEYPFNVAQFKDTLVKFIEEGVVEAPRFQEYRVSKKCPYKVNNIKNVGTDDIILVMIGTETCEKLKISNDTLILSGFSEHTGEDYQIIYKKEE